MGTHNEKKTSASQPFELLLEISSTLANLHDSTSLNQKIVDYSVELLHLGSAAIYLFSGVQLRLEATCPPLPPDFPDEFRAVSLPDHPHIQRSLTGTQPVILPDTHAAELTPAEREVCARRDLRSLLYLPLMYKKRQLGALIMGSVGEPHDFSREEVNICRALANLAALQIEETRLYEANQHYLRALEREIRQHRQTEETLAESEAHFRSLIENAPYGIFVQTEERFAYLNPAALGLFGAQKPQELLGKPVIERFHPFFHDIARERIWQLNVEKKIVPSIEEIWLRMDETPFDVQVSAVPIHWRGKDGALVFFQDITDRKIAQAALQESEEKFRLFFESANVGYSMTDLQGRITVNQAYADMLGYSLGELEGKIWQELTPAEEIESIQSILASILKGEKDSARFDKRYIHKDGSHIWTDVSTRLRRNSQGEPLYFISTVTNISERKRAEQLEKELAKREEAEVSLKHREAILSAVAFSAEWLLMSADWEKEMEIILAQLGEAAGASRTYLFQSQKNESGEMMTSWRFEWCAPYIPSQINNSDLQNFPFTSGGFSRWQDLLERGEVIRGPVRLFPQTERDALASQGTQSLLIIPVFANERLWGHIGIEQVESEREWSTVEEDALVTAARTIGLAIERKEAESALQQAQQELIAREKLATLGQLAGGVGHELRNPLGVISNAVYILEANLSHENEKARQYARMIAQQVGRSNKIISDLLNFAREPSASPEEVDVREAARRVLADFPPPPDVSVRSSFARDLPKAFADPQHMEQVLANLVSNACQAMPEGGRLGLRAFHKNGEVHIAISDSGEGINSENIKKIFTPLFTTKARGIGLGLATSKKLAETNGGRILVKSHVGQGSTFTLVLPIAGGAHGT